MNPDAIHQAFSRHQRAIWGLCYRMTGNAADADDLVQDTFARVLERPPTDLDRSLAPWLVRVSMNLSRDLLRKRRRQDYHGVWLPSPIETHDGPPPTIEVTLADGTTTDARYDLLESVSFAFLLALEALSPTQRAVLLLRDVFSHSVHETAEALGLSAANVKTTLHRARKAIAAYDHSRFAPSAATHAAHRATLVEFFTSIANDDVPRLEALLARDVRLRSDGGGEFVSAGVPIVGVTKVLNTVRKIAGHRGPIAWFDLRELNGGPGLLVRYDDGRPNEARNVAFHLQFDEVCRIVELHTVLATRKLCALRFSI